MLELNFDVKHNYLIRNHKIVLQRYFTVLHRSFSEFTGITPIVRAK